MSVIQIIIVLCYSSNYSLQLMQFSFAITVCVLSVFCSVQLCIVCFERSSTYFHFLHIIIIIIIDFRFPSLFFFCLFEMLADIKIHSYGYYKTGIRSLLLMS